MAQRAIIGINGELTPFDASLDKIRTPGIGASAVTWVPDADTRCTTLRVTANGTYNAAQRGDYGYDYVTVSVPGTSVTGRDPDTGEEVQVGVDPETGDIVETVLATEIRITTPPTKITYVDGETIDYSGIVVHAYSATGQDMGAVPYGQLVFPVTVAKYSESGTGYVDTDGVDRSVMYSPNYDFEIFCAQTSLLLFYVEGTSWLGYRVSFSTPVYAVCKSRTDRISEWVFVSTAPFYYVQSYIDGSGEPRTVFSSERTREGITYYIGTFSVSAGIGGKVETNMDNVGVTHVFDNGEPVTGYSNWDVAYLIFNGTVDENSRQEIPVNWPRTGDGAVLETSFDIQVTPAGGDTP